VAGGSNPPDRKDEGLPELPVPGAVPSPGDQTLAGLLGERYRAIGRLGAGAFGEVYRAHDSVLGRDVAIKRIRLEAFVEASQLEDVKRRFLREAQVAARLRHPNIVTTHDIVATPETFIVMELVEGQTLQSLLQSRERLPLDETVGLLAQAALALDHAHANQVVHRDVKPGNIMIEPSGQVKVMDFGIAKAETGTNLTSTGSIMGTPNYMSPEQAQGLKVDGRSDLFSLGCVLYECLTGRKPFQGESITAILLKILREEPPLVDLAGTSLPPGIDTVLRRAMAKDPAARYPTGAALMDALRMAGQATVVSSPTARRAPPPPPLPDTGPGVVAPASPVPRPAGGTGRLVLALAVIAALAAGALWGWGALSRAGEKRLAGEGGGLVFEEGVSPVGRLLGRAPRLLVTIPAGTRLRLALESPLSSQTARAGEAIAAEVTSPVRVEGVLAVAAGEKLTGRVLDAAPAEDAEGRGRMTLQFETLEPVVGERRRVEARPLALRAPPTKKKDAGIIAGLAGVGAAVGGLIGGKGGAVAGTVVGGAAGVAVVTTDKGREVTLPERAPLTIELLGPATVTRPRQP
jgi:tRNA A-37 threonylcarbamoyl transferase component Bud32